MALAARLLTAALVAAHFVSVSHAVMGGVTQVSSFTLDKSPSGMFFYPSHGLLYILCGTNTNGDHYLYAYGTDGTQKCFITIPTAVGMSRVDGFQIVGSDAYIVDSQGPIYKSTAGKLGGSVYKVTWTNPCGCDSSGTCTSSTSTWSPTVTKQWAIGATDAGIGDGGGVDNDFRNSGIIVSGDYLYAVNGVHSVQQGVYNKYYPKSLVKIKMADSAVSTKWSFTASTLGRDVDMEGLSCGADECANYIYIGDEYNYIYKLKLATADPATAVEVEWNINSIVGNVNVDKGIESLTYASTTGYFYAGIQGTSKVHVLQLTDPTSPTPTPTPTPSPTPTATPSPTPTPTPTPTPSPSPSPSPTTSAAGQASSLSTSSIPSAPLAGALVLFFFIR